MALPDQVELLCMAVQKKAAAEAEKIMQDAGEKHDRTIQRGIEQRKRQQEEQKLKLRKKAYQDARRQIDAAELKARRMVMATREQIFSRVMEGGRKKLMQIKENREEYEKILLGMMKKAAGMILGAGSQGLEIRCSRPDRDVVSEAAGKLPDELKDKVRLSEKSADIEGGIMAFSQDGKQLIDLSFGAVISRIEPDIRAAAADRLFKETEKT